jgi:hypothetical protein
MNLVRLFILTGALMPFLTALFNSFVFVFGLVDSVINPAHLKIHSGVMTRLNLGV